MTNQLRRMVKRVYHAAKFFSPIPQGAKYFILIAQERTGSTLLSDLLSFHPKILMDRHYFHTPLTWPDHYRNGRTVLSRKPVRGYKLKITHTPRQDDPTVAGKWLRSISSGIFIMRLWRQNALRQGLSAHLASQSGQLHIRRDTNHSSSTENGKTVIDVDEVIGNVNYYCRLRAFEESALKGVPHLAINYERDLLPQDEHQNTANKMFRYLGQDPAKVETRLRRTSGNKVGDRVANYDELVSELKEEGLDHFLAE